MKHFSIAIPVHRHHKETSTMPDPSTVIADIKQHLAQIETKMEEIYTVHLPAVREFAHTLESNPLVTAFASVIPGGELSGDAMAILNGLAPLLGALGAKVTQPAAPAIPPTPGGDATGSPSPISSADGPASA